MDHGQARPGLTEDRIAERDFGRAPAAEVGRTAAVLQVEETVQVVERFADRVRTRHQRSEQAELVDLETLAEQQPDVLAP